MAKTRIVGLAYETSFPKATLRLHQDEPEHFVLELGTANVDLDAEQLNALPEALAELVAFVTKRRAMAKNLLEQG